MPSAPVSRVRPTAYSLPSVVRAWQGHRQCVHRSLQRRFRAECLNAHWFLSLADAPRKKWGIGAGTTMKNGPTGRSAIDRRFCCKPRRRHPARNVIPAAKLQLRVVQCSVSLREPWAQPPNLGALVPPCNAAELAQALVNFPIAPPRKRRLLGLLCPLSTAIETMVDAQVVRYQRLTRHLSQLEALPSNPPSSNRAKSTRCRPL
jgi:hypothetical protein